jgi:hypothetical protein
MIFVSFAISLPRFFSRRTAARGFGIDQDGLLARALAVWALRPDHNIVGYGIALFGIKAPAFSTAWAAKIVADYGLCHLLDITKQSVAIETYKVALPISPLM